MTPQLKTQELQKSNPRAEHARAGWPGSKRALKQGLLLIRHAVVEFLSGGNYRRKVGTIFPAKMIVIAKLV